MASSPAATRRNVRLARTQIALGLAMTLLAGIMWFAGVLGPVERLTLDWRAQWFGSSSPGPSERLAVIAIDQAALDNIGRWPWKREDLALIIRELDRAGVKVISLDLLLNDPEKARWVPTTTLATASSGEPAPAGTQFVSAAGDDALASAIEAHAKVVVAAGFQFESLTHTAQANKAGKRAGRASGPASTTPGGAPDAEPSPDAPAGSGAPSGSGSSASSRVTRISLSQVYAELEQNPALRTAPFDQAVRSLVRRLLPQEAQALSDGPEFQRLISRLGASRILARHESTSSVASTRVTSEAGGALRFPISVDPATPIGPIGLAAARLGNVTFDSFDADGLTRRIPLWVEHHGRLWPNLGLASALALLDIDPAKVRVERDKTVIPGDGPRPEFSLHMRRVMVSSGEFDGVHLIAWPRALLGKPFSDDELRGWQWPFYNLSTGSPLEISIGRVFEPSRIDRVIAGNLAQVDRAARLVLLQNATTPADADNPGSLLNKADQEELTGTLSAALSLSSSEEIWADYFKAIKGLLSKAQPRAGAELDALSATEDLPARERFRAENLREAMRAIPLALREIDEGLINIAKVRADLRRTLDGKLCFVGWTATGALADFVGTSIDPKTPGVHLHAAVANSILMQFDRTPVATWVDLSFIALLGIVGTLVGVRASVVAAPIICLMLIAGWFGFVGYVLWDSAWLVVSFAGPACALVFPVIGVFVHRLVVEQASRRRTEERFKSRVAPQLVDILVNNPEMDTMKPQRRELTVMFTDLQGFTTTAERLGEVKTAEVLARFLGTMTGVVLANGATLDKYIGDAIVTFWGAPIDNPRHAADACRAVLAMLHRLDEMNRAGEFAEVGPTGLTMRVGLSAGDVMVGDFGAPPTNSSYTTLGDTTNLAARLEGANKVFGSRILVSARLKTLAEEHVAQMRRLNVPPRMIPPLIWRALGRVRVKGKLEPVGVYELVGDLAPFGERTPQWILTTERLIATYQAGDFDACDSVIAEYTGAFGNSALLDLYRDAMIEWAARVDRAEAFDGCVELKEK